MAKLSKLRMAGVVEEALMILPFEDRGSVVQGGDAGRGGTAASRPEAGRWSYLGPKMRGFVMTFSQVGAVMCGCCLGLTQRIALRSVSRAMAVP